MQILGDGQNPMIGSVFREGGLQPVRICMPYFDAKHTDRYAMKDSVAITIEDFIKEAKKKAISPEQLEEIKFDEQIYTMQDKGLPVSIEDGERHTTLVSYAGSLRAKGLSIEEIEIELITVNDVRCNPPLSDKDIRCRWYANRQLADRRLRQEPDNHIRWRPGAAARCRTGDARCGSVDNSANGQSHRHQQTEHRERTGRTVYRHDNGHPGYSSGGPIR